MSVQIGTFQGAAAEGAPPQRLRGWKQIASYFGTNESTVKRWEASRGLPVHRGGHGVGVSVYADARELEKWLNGDLTGEPAPMAPALPQAAPGRRPRRIRAALTAAAALAAAAPLLVSPRPAPPSHRPERGVADLQLDGVYNLERRTPDSLRRALADFSAAARRDPLYAAPYAGIANAWLLLREFAAVPDPVAYARARAAAERALALDPKLADAHLALAFVQFYGDRRFGTGLDSFERSVRLDPGSARAQHWYATALAQAGDALLALDHIRRAQSLDPESRSILADKGLILCFAGRRDEGDALLRRIEASEPDFYSPPYYRSLFLLAEGRDREFVAEALSAARLRKDGDGLAVARAADAGLRRGGRAGMLRAMLAEQRRLRAQGHMSLFRLASTEALIGDRIEALNLLEGSARAAEPYSIAIRTDPTLASLRGDPLFRELSAALDS